MEGKKQWDNIIQRGKKKKPVNQESDIAKLSFKKQTNKKEDKTKTLPNKQKLRMVGGYKSWPE